MTLPDPIATKLETLIEVLVEDIRELKQEAKVDLGQARRDQAATWDAVNQIAKDFECVAQLARMIAEDVKVLKKEHSELADSVMGVRRRLAWYEGALALLGVGVAWLGSLAASLVPTWVHK